MVAYWADKANVNCRGFLLCHSLEEVKRTPSFWKDTHICTRTHSTHTAESVLVFSGDYTRWRQNIADPKVFRLVSVETKEVRSELADW